MCVCVCVCVYGDADVGADVYGQRVGAERNQDGSCPDPVVVAVLVKFLGGGGYLAV